MDLTTKDQQDDWNALERLLRIGRKDTGQARCVANFQPAWHNAEENGRGIRQTSGASMRRSPKIC
jgi:hypothetical protein